MSTLNTNNVTKNTLIIVNTRSEKLYERVHSLQNVKETEEKVYTEQFNFSSLTNSSNWEATRK